MSADPPIPIDPDFRIQLPNFEGPLDLLLFLIQKHELDVIDLPVAFVTEKYVEYLGLMQRLNLDVAAEYLLMAATLAHIKSKSLLPPDPSRDAAEDAEQDEQDPRAELIKRLLEYQKYKKVAEELGARGVAGRDVFTRGSNAVGPLGPAPLAELSVFKLLDAFRKIAEQVKGEMSLEVSAERITIQERITEIVEILRVRKTIVFEQLFAGVTTTYELVVSFLALLEMAKMRMLRIYQADPDSPIHLEGRLLDETDDREDDPSVASTFGPRERAAETSEPETPSPIPPDVPAPAPDESAEEPASIGFWPEGATPGAPSLDYWHLPDEIAPAESVDPDSARAARPLSPRASAPPATSDNDLDPDAHFWPLDAHEHPSERVHWDASESDPPSDPLAVESDALPSEESFWPLDPSDSLSGADPWPRSEPPTAAELELDPDRPARALPPRPSISAPPEENEHDPVASFWPLDATQGEAVSPGWPIAGTDLDSQPPLATDALDSGDETRQDPGLGAESEPEDPR